MNSSYLTLLALGLGMTFVGCSGDNADTGDNNPTDNTDGDDDDDTTPTGDTSPEPPEFLEITNFSVQGQFAFDGAGIVTATDLDGNPIANIIDLILFSDTWSGSFTDVDEWCYVEISLDGAQLGEWVSETDGVLYGVDALEDAEVTTDCHDPTAGKVVDTERWGTDITQYWLAGDETWGVGLGEYGQDLLDWIDTYAQSNDTTEYQDLGMLGAYLKFPDPDIFPGMYAYGYQIDGANVIMVDENEDLIPYSYDDAINNGALPPGLYQFDSVWTFINIVPPY